MGAGYSLECFFMVYCQITILWTIQTTIPETDQDPLWPKNVLDWNKFSFRKVIELIQQEMSAIIHVRGPIFFGWIPKNNQNRSKIRFDNYDILRKSWLQKPLFSLVKWLLICWTVSPIEITHLSWMVLPLQITANHCRALTLAKI